MLIFSQAQNTSRAEWEPSCATKERILTLLVSSRVNPDFVYDTAGGEDGAHIQICSGTFFSQVLYALMREMQQTRAQRLTEYLPQRTNAQSSVRKALALWKEYLIRSTLQKHRALKRRRKCFSKPFLINWSYETNC